MMKIISLTFFLGLFSAALFSAEVKLDAKVDKALVSTGDLVMFTVTLDTPKGLSLPIPNVGDKIQGFRIVDFGTTPEKLVDDRNISSLWYKLQADLVGSYILPALEIKYKNSKGVEESIKSSEIFVEVESVLSKDKSAKKDIRDIKPIILSPARWPYYLAAGILVLLLAGFGVSMFKKIRKKKNDDAFIRPPHEVALEALQRLPRTPLKLYAFSLSEIVRIYFEKIFFLPVTDKTIEEIKRDIGSVTSLDQGLRKQFIVLLEKTDLIKFTDSTITDGDSETLVQIAQRFVKETMPKEVNKENEEDNIV